MDLISVEGHPHLYRDAKTGAIVNCDSSSYQQYMRSLETRKKSKDEIKNLKNEIVEIKSLLQELINGSK